MGQDGQDGTGQDPVGLTADTLSDALKAQDLRNERRIFWSELVILLVVALLVAAYVVAVRFSGRPVPGPDL